MLVERPIRGLELLTLDNGSVVDSRVIDGKVAHVFGTRSMVSAGGGLLLCVSCSAGPDNLPFEIQRIDADTGASTSLIIATYPNTVPSCELIETPVGIAVVFSDNDQLHAGLLDPAGDSWIVPPVPTHEIDSVAPPTQFVLSGSRLVGISAPYLYPIALPTRRAAPQAARSVVVVWP